MRARGLVALAGFLLLAGAQAAVAKVQAPAQPLPPQGYEVFRGILAFHGIKPLPKNAEAGGNVLIVDFSPEAGRQPGAGAQECEEVLAAGGSALLASDRPFDWGDHLGGGDLRTTGYTARAPSEGAWLGRPGCPLARPLPQSFNLALTKNGFVGDLKGAWPPLAGLGRVAANDSATLVCARKGPHLGDAVAGFPAATADRDTGRRFPAAHALMWAGARDRRLLVAADPSLFSNQMMLAADDDGRPTDNFEFADRLVRWLARDGQIEFCRFREAGWVVEKFDDVPLTPTPPLPDISIDPWNPKLQGELTDLANEALDKIQRDDVINRRLADRLPRILRGAALALAALLAVLLFRKWMRGPAPAGGARVDPLPDAPGRADKLAAYLAAMFAAAGVEVRPGPLPQLERGAPRTLRKDLAILWATASGADRAELTQARWAQLRPRIERARRLYAEGRWQFAGAAPTATTGPRETSP